MTATVIGACLGALLLILVIGGILFRLDSTRRSGNWRTTEPRRRAYCLDCGTSLLTRGECTAGVCTWCQLELRTYNEWECGSDPRPML